ncbi:MAG: hypothetical protein SVV80_11815 [Planctomycetota bacterium]|nr:hypothetical protein [Planctomycetota bacterium]
MPTLTEKLDSRKWNTGDNASVEMVYVLAGTSDDLTAKTLIENSTAETYDGLTRQSINLEPEWVDTASGDGQWLATIRYGVKPPAEVGESSFSFDTGGGTQHITQSISTVSKYAPPGKTAPDFQGAVGVTHDNVEGVDITVPVYNFSETHYIDDGDVNKGAYFALTGKVNNAAWKGFAAGEVLFLGASGSKRGSDDWEITFRFAASPNKTGLTVGKQEIGAVQMPRGNIVSFASLICFPYFRNDFGISFELGFEGKVDIHDQILFRIAKEQCPCKNSVLFHD